MFKSKYPKVTITMPQKALEAVFDECDRYEIDETGGRIIGSYKKKGRDYQIDVLGVIGPGPNAKRTPTSFFQDGDYQERVFREVEKDHANLEHLGNWHSHHGNGLETLSGGDRATYHRTVNHGKHNTDFFYALLVTRRTPQGRRRYEVKHYILFRGDDTIHEIEHSQIQLVDKPFSGDSNASVAPSASQPEPRSAADANLERTKDQEFFSQFFPGLQPAFSKSAGAFYWKGDFALIDGSHANILAMENTANKRAAYSITITKPKGHVANVLDQYRDRSFPSARHAVLQLERDVNRELYRRAKE
jgi:Prokaryotic homologs of the JAB domain